LNLCNQARSLTGAQQVNRRPLAHQLLGVIAEHAFSRGIDVREAAIQADANHAWASRIEQIPERIGLERWNWQGRRGIADQEAQRHHHCSRACSKSQKTIESRAGRQPGGNPSNRQGHSQAGERGP